MSVRHLDYLFRPKSVAVIGASNRPGSIGSVVMRNLLQGGFEGPIIPVNPKAVAVNGVLAYPDVASLPVVPEMAVICTPAKTVPGLISELGERGTRAAVVITAGLATENDETGKTLTQAMLDAAKPYQLRVLGPNCLGLIVPGLGLNASFAHANALPGRVAFVSQSGGLTTAVLDYARSYGLGFSYFLSLGDSADVDFGDVLDYLGYETETSAILLYIEAIDEARKFMSAARAAARNKPVLVIKAGRNEEGARAAASHTGALAGADDVYEAAFRRAGMLRVYAIDELFDAVQTLSHYRPLRGDRLAILTNGGGPGVMAVDALIDDGGKLAQLSEATITKLDAKLPATWSRSNPVDIIGDAPPERYAAALESLLADPEVDAVLVMHVPTAVSQVDGAATAVAEITQKTNKNVLTSWMGRDGVERARKILLDAGIPSYFTPDRAVRAFMHMVHYRANQEMLMETPASAPEEFTPATATARLVIENAVAAGRNMLSEAEAKAVLAAYGIPIVETRLAQTPEDAVRVASEVGFPVAMKILSPDISHKSDVGGVALDLETPQAVEQAARAMLERVHKLAPDAKLTGFTVQQMARRPGAQELIVGVTTDDVFGPVILFGQGGTAVEVIADRAVALPPLNMHLAEELVSRTRIAKLLAGYRDRPPADMNAICLTLMQISQLITDLNEVVELDINPLFADHSGVLALDARIKVGHGESAARSRMAIRAYPKQLEEKLTLKSGQPVLLRPVRPEDEPEHAEFLAKLSPEDLRFRFFGLVRDFPHMMVSRFTQIDYDREMAFIAQAVGNGHPETLGVVRAIMDPDNTSAEFSIIVRSDMKGQGMGGALMDKIVRYCRSRGVREIVGQVLKENEAMLGLAQHLGFETRPVPDDPDTVEVRYQLTV